MTALTQSRPSISRRVFVLGGLGALGWAALDGLCRRLDLSTGATVATDSPHSWVRHGVAEVTTVRQAMTIMAAQQPTWFDRPPCKDGRHRYWLQLADGRWAVWVLQQVGNGVFQEVTAFITRDHAYVQALRDHCGIDGWFGHSFAGG